MESRKLSDFAEKIVQYQESNHLTDAEFALLVRLSVERFHALKTMKVKPTGDEIDVINAVVNQ